MNLRRYKLVLGLVLLAGLNTSLHAKMNVGTRPPRPNQILGRVAETCPVTTAQIDLDINGVRARVLVGGDLWWDPVGQVPYYEVPIGSNKNALFSGALWIGGIDKSGQLKVAAQTYRQQGSNDFWGGPISRDPAYGSIGGIADARCTDFDKFWPITRSEVETFVSTGEATKAIREWPGNGNITQNELQYLAPFFDSDNDGLYDYTAGDYPYFLLAGDYPVDPGTGTVVCNDYLFGDKSIWWVFNDVGNVKTETQSDAIGLEVRSQAFAFKTADEVNFMTFYKYQVINRSSDSLSQTYFGVWSDPDLGNAADDYVGCDVSLGLGYCYNGDPDDDGGQGYGINPPAIGIDFFQGPLADVGDGLDNDKDGVTDEPGEQIIMSKFVYYENVNNVPNGNPATTDDYYEYLSGFWADGQQITFGGSGRDVAAPPTNYMFSNGTDPDFSGQIWTMVTAGIQPNDMRWLQSAGTFTLAPGAVNYITTGVVWARATSGGPLASVTLVKLADQKAQALFDNCFKILDGPNAPDLAVRELDRTILISLENTRNEKVELYNEIDPTIPTAVPTDSGNFDTLSVDERSYKFQGYLIYQVADETVSEADISDPAKAKLLKQIDVRDDIGQIVNYTFDNTLNSWVPEEKTRDGFNAGLEHTFTFTLDAFTQKQLVNYRPYYYLVVSYAYNNYRPFDPNNASFTQYRPYVQGRNNVRVYSAIPHPQVVQSGGTVLNASVGEGLEIKRIEGQGNGGNVLDLTDATVNEILFGGENRALNPVYQAGGGPVKLGIYDPMSVKSGGFKLVYGSVADNDYWYLMPNPEVTATVTNVVQDTISTRMVITTSAPLGVEAGQFIRVTGAQGITSVPSLNGWLEVATVNGTDYRVQITSFSGTYTGSGSASAVLDRSVYTIDNKVSQLYEPGKISIDGSKINGQEPGNEGAVNNGFMEATMTFSDPSRSWLTGVQDVDAATKTSQNWILSGSTNLVDFQIAGVYQDPDGAYETVLGGTWAPYFLVSNAGVDGVPKDPQTIVQASLNNVRYNYLHSADVVLTNDKTKWSRCVVMELGSGTTIGGAPKFTKRRSASVDKEGRPYGDPSANAAEAGLTDTIGMGWFPGYALNVETGERLNLIFGENSADLANNGGDMKWNPTDSIINANNKVIFGGMHYIYVLNRDTAATGIQLYDEGKRADSLITSTSAPVKRNLYRVTSWVNLPVLTKNHGLLETDVKIRLRINRNYKAFTSVGATTNVNNGNPHYEFGVPESKVASKGVKSVAEDALDLIRVVPNPYYAYSSYEKTRKDQLDNRVRITNLPSRCTVSIYTLNGTLIRQLKRDVSGDLSNGVAVSEGRDDNQAATLDWDLKNTAGITVASGVYIIHVDAGDLGEKVVKWFGVMRPIDLDSF
jgi:hypothetical protein